MSDNPEIQFEILLKTEVTSVGQKITYPTNADAEITIMRVIVPPGQSTGWHQHQYPAFGYILKGSLTIELPDGELLSYCQNTAVSEVVHLSHNGINNGDEDVVLIAFFMGEKDQPLSEG
jgi:quercetin dioxygenase-like cupin family protein